VFEYRIFFEPGNQITMKLFLRRTLHRQQCYSTIIAVLLNFYKRVFTTKTTCIYRWPLHRLTIGNANRFILWQL